MAAHVILVNEHDVQIGTAEKLEAHRRGVLHRAFSVHIVDGSGRVLLQRRAPNKYHSAGLWSNACCSHPEPGEPIERSAHRRLRQEMGFDCLLRPAFSLLYHCDLGGGLFEHEYDHVFVGRYQGDPDPDPAEVDAWRWARLDEVRADAIARPERYTAWFRILLARPEADLAG
jgi:isopentenyl-diphosphate Delta-isomerase